MDVKRAHESTNAESPSSSAMPPTRKVKRLSVQAVTPVTRWLSMETQDEMKAARAEREGWVLVNSHMFVPISPAPISNSAACVVLKRPVPRLPCIGNVSIHVKNILVSQLPDMELKMPRLSQNAEQDNPLRSTVCMVPKLPDVELKMPCLSPNAEQNNPLRSTVFRDPHLPGMELKMSRSSPNADQHHPPLSASTWHTTRCSTSSSAAVSLRLEQNKTGNTLLHDAAKEGDLIKIEFLLKKGMLVAARNVGDETPAFCATVTGNSHAAALLQSCSRH